MRDTVAAPASSLTAVPARPLRLRWAIVALLMVAAAINYIDRSCIGIAAPRIQQEFHLSDTQIGLILGVFQAGYVAAYILSGVIVDRIGARAGYPLFMAVWSCAVALTSLGRRVWQFVWLRVLLGVGEAGCWPTSNKVVAEWFPQPERPLACGLFDGGSKLGMVLGPPLITALVVRWGWRWPFAAAGAAGFVWIALWITVYRRPQTAPAAVQSGATQAGSRWRELLRYPQVWGVLVLNASTATTWFVLSNWLPKYYYEVHRIDFRLLGWYASMPMIGAALGNVVGGWLLGWLIHHRSISVTRARRAMIIASVAMMTCLIPAAYIPRVGISTVLMAVVGMGYSTHATNILSSISDLVSPRYVATLTGIQATGAFILTLPVVTYAGWIVERLGYKPLFVTCACLPCLSIAAAYLLIRSFTPIQLTGSGN
jgi:ACS family hexuronate transporter-like MFS transporter